MNFNTDRKMEVKDKAGFCQNEIKMHMKILLVEDNEGDILLTQEALYESNPETKLHIVRDGEAALDYLFKRGRYKNAESPELIILDINIPRKNGHEVLRTLKASKEYCMIPIIFLTTSTADKDIIDGYKNGVNCYVVKDFIFDDLNHVVVQIEQFWRTVASIPNAAHA